MEGWERQRFRRLARHTASNTYLCAAASVRNCRSAALRSWVRSPLRLPSSAAWQSPAFLAPLLGADSNKHSTTTAAPQGTYTREYHQLSSGRRLELRPVMG